MGLVAVLAGCGGSDDTPSATVSSPATTQRTTTTTATASTAASTTSTTTKPLTTEKEVEAAYLKSWHVYAKAVRTLDASGLEASYAGRALRLATEDVETLKSKHTPVRCRVEHHYTIHVGGGEFSSVRDDYVNHCVKVDPTTQMPAEPDPNQQVLEVYTLQLIEGSWMVTGVQASS